MFHCILLVFLLTKFSFRITTHFLQQVNEFIRKNLMPDSELKNCFEDMEYNAMERSEDQEAERLSVKTGVKSGISQKKKRRVPGK